MPLFAQPLPSRSSPRRFADPVLDADSWAGTALLFLPAALCLALLVVARPDGAQNLPANARETRAKFQTRDHSGAAPIRLAQNDDKSAEAIGEGDADRRPLSYYTQTVRGTMFSAPRPPVKKASVVKPQPPKKIEKAPPVPVVEIKPFADWTYSGTIHIGTEIMALLENTKSRDGQYIRIGESFMGAQVASITDQQVTLMLGGKPNIIAKSDTMTITPLNKSADFLGGGQAGQPGQPQPGQPGPQPGGPVMMNAPVNFGTLNNMTTITPRGAVIRSGRKR